MATVESDGATIYYEVHGDGPAVAFAHGRGGNAASWWQQVPHFARTYKCIPFDHRCFGRSRCAPENFDRTKFAADFLAILDAEKIERTAIVCQSMGGWTGLATAVRHPERVACLVLSNTPGGLDTPGVRDALAQSRDRFARQGVGRAAVAADFPKRNPEAAYLYTHINSLNVNLPTDLNRGGAGTISPDELKGYKVPTLLITSEHDVLFPPALIREVAAAIPDSQVIELPTAGHSPYFETPAAFNETVGAFLAKHL